ncbi:peptide chain release factor 1 [Candidatus Latescibacterota bacterium]
MNTSIKESMDNLVERYRDIGEQLGSPTVLSNPPRIAELGRERAELAPKVETYERYQTVNRQLEEARELLREEEDPDMTDLAESEIELLETESAVIEERLRIMLLPTDPMDGKNIIMEIRAGTGGEEAALFALELYRMYTHYADAKGWKVEPLSSSSAEAGGFKEIIFSTSGENVYSHLKYESGVHRVQRVPVTEASGRIHTSAASVVVMPEAEDIAIDINPDDLKVDVFRSSGPGGQSVNTTDSAVRITHLPTGIVVSCQDEKSQLKNKNKAMKVLRARLNDRARQKQEQSRSQVRRLMVGSGDRSAKIRTYNYPQNRVTDHRINLTLYTLDSILAGDLDEFIEEIRVKDQKEALAQQMKAPLS